MTTKKTTPQAVAETPAVAGDQSVATVAVPVFRDSKFTSRTLILSDGKTASVVAGKIEANTDELLAFLTADADFERLPE